MAREVLAKIQAAEAENAQKLRATQTLIEQWQRENEEKYRALWRRFYDTIAVEGRENPKCRMTHMPKRYWAHLTEMQGREPQAAPKALTGGYALQ